MGSAFISGLSGLGLKFHTNRMTLKPHLIYQLTSPRLGLVRTRTLFGGVVASWLVRYSLDGVVWV